MMRALYTAATGMIAEQTNLDTISHNLSNVNTTGYKNERTEFKSLLYQTLQTRTTTANGEQKPVGAQVGLGTRVAATMSMYTQGALLASESPTDFALESPGSLGFFAVRGIDGETYYTRNGNFTWAKTADGGTMLTDAEGCPVLDTEGNVIMVPEGVSSGNMIFSQKLSSSRLQATAASGNPMLEGATPGLKLSKVHEKYLEGSNVQVADEMVNMIIAQRAYELNSKAIITSDSMLDTANNLKR